MQAYNNRLRRGGFYGVIGAYRIMDVALTLDAKRNAAGSPVAESGLFDCQIGRTIADATITAGTNVLTSASAPFGVNDNGQIVVLPAGSAGANRPAMMNFVNSTTVNLTTLSSFTESTTAFNAVVGIAGGTASLDVLILTEDGLHMNRYGYNRVRDSGVVSP